MPTYRQGGWRPFLMTPHAARQLNTAAFISLPLRHIIVLCVSFLLLHRMLASTWWDLWIIEIQPLKCRAY